MRILSLDTACDLCTLVLSENGASKAARSVQAGRDQAKILAPLAEEFLQKQKMQLSQIDRLAVCTGPGSFTGLRIGIAFMRGFSLAGKKPLFGFDHFACTEAALKRLNKLNAPVLMIRSSKRAELFACITGQNTPLLGTPSQLNELLQKQPGLRFTGNGAAELLAEFPALAARHLPLEAEEIVFSAALLAQEAPANTAPAQPVYLREADVTLPRSA
ncbi:MAG TPA: tRNA (adenosine(37)-N6)-threonylcarbamoyltransferase complex dimerization subunit type 1 TsaB [Alphaproteobacteria bacterium]|nr:tRNA (adenosine(37)-N6)-threonylcarbamoyltransferase complex dimerization subunit type 1 TsaB [Alphaproteobacteria bacterium]